MSRQARKKSKTGIYHIMARGVNRQIIFRDNEDCAKFIDTIRQTKEKSGFKLYGYCLMGNHVHMLLQEGVEAVSLTMQRLCSSFVYWYNRKYDRLGHLFQERYRSEVVEDERYLLIALRYIHQNPIKAGLTNMLEEYQWSSYREYIYNYKQKIIDTEFILELFGGEKQTAMEQFKKYMSAPNKDVCLEYEERHRITDNELIRLIEGKYGVKKELFHLMDRQQKDMILRELKAIDGITIRQLARVTGVSKFMVEKA